MNLPSYDDVLAAEPVVRRHLAPTALYEWPLLSATLGFRYLLKHENHQPTGAFKVRGGVNLLARLSDADRRRGIVACTTGNHGQSLAYASRLFGVPCVLVVPRSANPDKVAAMRALGAGIVEHGNDFDDARTFCDDFARQRFLRYVHSANEPDLIAGVGTMALEIFERLPTPDVVLVPIGLGSGVCGTCLVASSRKTKVIGVQAEGAPAVARSWRENRVVEMGSPATFAEGVATRKPAEMTLALMRRYLYDMVLVSDDELRDAIGALLRTTHNLAEGAGAAATAAAFKLRERLQGKTVVGILSGGNLDLRELRTIADRFASNGSA
ncbi:MAG TPA: threonine dehydratase [Pirellulales bacterium]|nr:threonine dehydratase [Pirellulales bacterium]